MAGEETAANLTAAQQVEGMLAPIKSFLEKVLRLALLKMSVQVRAAQPGEYAPDTPLYVVEISGPDADVVLDSHAAMLDALEHVARRVAHMDETLHPLVAFDCHQYRLSRLDELKLTAQIAAEQVRERGEPFALGRMNSRERRVVHLTLRDQQGIRTESQGEGLDRHLVIFPDSKAR
jgi:spoIIIJ-associated protein